MNLLRPPRNAAYLLVIVLSLASSWSRLPAMGVDVEPAGPPLKFGMSTALTGPTSDLGADMKAGVELAFAETNAAGGIQGRRLELVALDDGYEPSRALPNIKQLVEKEHVLAIIGNVGTPTAVAAVPIAVASRTPFYGAYTGAGVLRKDPPNRYVVNYRASYAEETAAIVDTLVKDAGLRPEDIAFFAQRDAYGDAGLYGGFRALRRHGLRDVSLIAHGRYERNTEAVENALADILQANEAPKAIILVGAYAPCAKFIRLAKRHGVRTAFVSVSFVGADSLADELGTDGEGVIVTQVVPHYDSDLSIVEDYRSALRRYCPETEPSFGGLEGYVATRVLLLALADLDEPPTRESIIDALEELGHFDIGVGIGLHFSSTDHQASHAVWPTVIRDGEVEPCDWGTVRAEVPAGAAMEPRCGTR